ncbi:HsdR family type I site-specific deoxyribonuclease [soil metagenome]
MSFTEYLTVEKEILDCLTGTALGWRFLPGKDVTSSLRSRDEQEALLIPILTEKLKALNPGVITDDDRARQVVTRLRALRDNQEWLAWLRGERGMKFSTSETEKTVRLIDFGDRSNNDFLATSQLWVQGVERRRPDILLYINGIPVVDVEAKTAARGYVDWAEGAKQTGRYAYEIPNLYASNCFAIGVNELRMLYGVPGAPLQYWQQWRDPFPHQVPAIDEMKVTLHGLLDHGNLLDLIQNFIVFETDGGKTVKKVARYQQFRAANKIMDRALDLGRPRNERRGIIWHTQGSGKSLTMIMAARKLWNHPALAQPTIIIVVDREQLHDQMIGELLKTNTANVVAAESVRDLQDKLAADHRGIIVTTVHKFAEAGVALSPRSNVIMLVDEANRSQEGDLGAFMRSALPNAALFGLTGTPIEQNDHNTPKAFGRELPGERFERYLDRYSIEDAMRDGATKPIHYEVRMTDWTVDNVDLDKKFEELFAEYPEEARRKLMGEAKLDAILKHPKRIAQISEDIARHFVEHVRPNSFKAMVVCRDKETCALYKKALDTLLSPEVSRVVISEDPVRDLAMVQEFYLGEAQRRKLVEDYKKPTPQDQEERDKPENRFRRVEILIVCDMLLTGFDAPILQAMYLDKGLRNHTLLQAIARVNRPHTELKRAGLILDYFGVFENLNDALNYDKNELGEVAFPFGRFREVFKDEMDRLTILFDSIARDGSHRSLIEALVRLNDDEEARRAFEKHFRNARVLYETLQPDEFLREFIADYTWLCKLHILYRKKFYPKQHFEVSDEDGAKTRALIREHVDVADLADTFPSYKLDENYLTKIKDLDPNAKALEIEAMLDAEIRLRLDEDEDVRPLSERLQRIIEQKRLGTMRGVQLLAELESLTEQVVEVVQESLRPVRNSIAKEVVKRVPDLAEDRALQVSDELLLKAKTVCFDGWWHHQAKETDLYRELLIVLVQRFKELDLHAKDNAFVEKVIRLLKKVRFCDEAMPS